MLYTSIAVMRIFDRLGDRKNLARNRMRYLVNDMGWEKFQNLVLKERAIVRATQSVVTKLKVDTTPDKITRPLKISDETHQALIKENIRCVKRGVGVRVSVHFYNTQQDVDHLLEVIDRATRQQLLP